MAFEQEHQNRENSEPSFLRKMMIFILCLFGSFLLVALLARTTLSSFFHIENLKEFWANPSSQLQHMDALIYLMILNGTVFIIASLTFSKLAYRDAIDHFQMSKKPDALLIFLACLTMVCAIPLVSFFSEATQALPWPESLKNSMDSVSSGSKDLQSALLNMQNGAEFVLILIILAVLPALGEELLVRGSLQQILLEERMRPAWAITLAALFFSAMHMQYENFLGIFTYGLILGFFYLWSQNLWVSILAHFFNNAAIVTSSYLFEDKNLEPGSDSLAMSALYALGSVMVVAIAMILFRRRAERLKLG